MTGAGSLRFEFATAGRIVFGPGTIAELGPLARAIGRRAFVVTGKDKIRHAGAIGDLEGAGLCCTLFGVAGEPTVAWCAKARQGFRTAGCELLIAHRRRQRDRRRKSHRGAGRQSRRRARLPGSDR